jgi:hypothetical protein
MVIVAVVYPRPHQDGVKSAPPDIKKWSRRPPSRHSPRPHDRWRSRWRRSRSASASDYVLHGRGYD